MHAPRLTYLVLGSVFAVPALRLVLNAGAPLLLSGDFVVQVRSIFELRRLIGNIL